MFDTTVCVFLTLTFYPFAIFDRNAAVFFPLLRLFIVSAWIAERTR